MSTRIPTLIGALLISSSFTLSPTSANASDTMIWAPGPIAVNAPTVVETFSPYVNEIRAVNSALNTTALVSTAARGIVAVIRLGFWGTLTLLTGPMD